MALRCAYSSGPNQARSTQPILDQPEQGQILLINPRRPDLRTFEAARLDARAKEDRSDLRENVSELLLRLVRHGREGIRWSNRAAVIVGQRVDQLVAETQLRLEIADPALVAEVCELRGLGDRVADPAEAVDQADLVRGSAVPHAPLRDLVDLLRRLVPSGCDDAEEAAIHGIRRRPGSAGLLPAKAP